ncbi:MAG: ribosome small subunit-dependent GTPase A [Breznakia sp.]
MIGIIIRIISNRYEVFSKERRYECVAMGKLRKGKSPVVGDVVDFEKLEDVYGIQRIHPRQNELKRPLIANVDQAIIVMSAKKPEFSTVLIDRLIFLIANANITPILCVTKMDLLDKDDIVHKKIEDYRKSGYEVYVSGKDMDIAPLKKMVAHKTSVLTGQSGVGKSSLLNRLDDTLQIKTQTISKALGRGRHTTRHSELFSLYEGWIADTPGFSSLDFSDVEGLRLAQVIPDFRIYNGMCKFNDCLHIDEPACAIRAKVESGDIVKYRYLHYKEVMEYIKTLESKY